MIVDTVLTPATAFFVHEMMRGVHSGVQACLIRDNNAIFVNLSLLLHLNIGN